METPKQRVKEACDRCRRKKAKCDGDSPCSRCVGNNAICSYGSDEGRRKTKHVASTVLIETQAQNEQLRRALHILYHFVRDSRALPSTPVPTGEDGRLLLHDIVAHVNSLPTASNFSSRETISSDMSSAQPETLLYSSSAFECPNLTTPSMLSRAPFEPQFPDQTPYGGIENRMDLQYLWSVADTDVAQTAALYNWLESYTMQ